MISQVIGVERALEVFSPHSPICRDWSPSDGEPCSPGAFRPLR
ncbi:MAG: hypothetical protein ACLQDY_25385 [Streptosporangiaceae bacterium]